MADFKSPSGFAPVQSTGMTQAQAPYTDSPGMTTGTTTDHGIHAAAPVASTTPQHIMGAQDPSAMAYTDTKGIAPPQSDTQHMVGSSEKAATQMQRAHAGNWTHGFWECFTPGDLCFKSCCCPCFVFGKTQARLEDPSLRTYESVNAPCGIFCLLNYVAGAGWVMAWLKRMEMRKAYNLKGSGGMDCLATCCCPCCALMQMDKEVVSRQSQGMAQAVAPQGYVANQGMSATPGM